MKHLKHFKIFENKQSWDEFHKLKSNNPKNPSLIYERDADKNIKKLILELEPNSRVLDLGCGDGKDSVYFSKNGFNVSALDFSDVIINENKDKYPYIDWEIYDISKANLPYKNNEFDLIFSRLSLHYFDTDNLNSILLDIKNKMKHNSILFFTVKYETSIDDKVKTGKKFMNIDEWRNILDKYFNNITISENTGKLYNFESKWLEIKCYKNDY